ncbi:DMT family transporter [Halocatena pleomorpha]|uniref:EamA family transporter n=1 Tax=Halocatena pleomorpha TaxID=1785090 RepID=A0A3P3R585_9EURY|nr:EamA family transporter [Halocatena pleomorpha]RRJ28647.1 EamA family transporter [Halocatena pleomorpha]
MGDRSTQDGQSERRAKRYLLAPLCAAALWGGMYVVSKWGFGAIPPLTLAFIRVVLGAATLFVLVRLTKPTRSFGRAEWYRFGMLAVWVAVTMATQFLGTALTTASQGALLTVLTPVFTLVLAVRLLGESLTRSKLSGMALATIGTVVVVGDRYGVNVAGGQLYGIGLLLLASLGWAAYTVYGKPLVRRYSALETATYSTILAVPMLGVLVPIELASVSIDLIGILGRPAVLGAVVYLGVFSTAIAWYLWYKGLEYVDAGTVAVFFFAQPVVGVALGVVVLGETVSPLFVIGGVVMAIGISVVSSAR